MLSNKFLVVESYQPIRTEKYKQKSYLPILNFSVVGLKMYATIAIVAICLYSHSNYLDSSLLVFSLWPIPSHFCHRQHIVFALSTNVNKNMGYFLVIRMDPRTPKTMFLKTLIFSSSQQSHSFLFCISQQFFINT